MATLEDNQIRKPVHSRCFGIEIETLVPRKNYLEEARNRSSLEAVANATRECGLFGVDPAKVIGFSLDGNDGFIGFFAHGYDGSIRTSYDLELFTVGREFVSQPLPYSWLKKEIEKLWNRLGGWGHNETCGIHVHVSKGIMSIKRAFSINKFYYSLTNDQREVLFGRPMNSYCGSRHNVLSLTEHEISITKYLPVSGRKTSTYEFRMFASGNAKWAQECLRRAKILCEFRGKMTYESVLEAFTNPENK